MAARARTGGVFTLFALMMMVLLPGAHAQWGMGRRGNKGDGAVRPEDIPGGLSFAEMQKLAKHEAEVAKKGGAGGGLDALGLGGLDLASLLPDGLKDADLSKVLDDMMQMPEIKKLLDDPEEFKRTLKENPILAAMPNIAELLDSPEFQDPEKIKKIMKDGVDAFKTYSRDVVEMMKDPAAMESATKYLEELMTEEEKDRLIRLATGDAGVMSEEMDRLRDVFGKSARAMAAQMADPEALETARKEYIEKGYGKMFQDPKMDAAAKDPEKWQAMMMDNMKLLYADADTKDEL